MLVAKFKLPFGWKEEEVKEKYPELMIGNKYEVEYISMGQSYTSIFLVGYENHCYNSVFFDFEEDGEPIDIYRSPKYNPYLSIFKE